MATEIQVTVNPNPQVYTIQIPGMQGIPGPKGDTGNPGDSNVLTIGTVTTGAAGSSASATISGATPNQILNLTIPRGNTGATGPANTLTTGTITTGAPGSSVVATITGTSPNQILNLTIPRGDVGPANALSIGTVTNATPGATGTVTVTGTSPTQVLNFTLPQPAITGTSSTSFTPGTGSKVFTTQNNLSFVVGQYVRAVSAANPTDYMAGNITAYSGTSLTVNVTESSGSTARTDWNITLTGVKGVTGNTGPAPVISTTSTTSLAIGTGTKVFTTAVAMNLVVGQTVKAWVTADTNSYMSGLITAISGTSLTLNVTETNNLGATFAAWTIALAGFKGGGVPTGGTVGNILYKASATDFDTTWIASGSTAVGNTFPIRDGNGDTAFNRVTVAAATPTTSAELTRKDYVDNGLATKHPTLLNTVNFQTGTAYTFVLADATREVDFNNASNIVVTIPTNATVAFPVGTVLKMRQFGAGFVNPVPAAGVTMNTPANYQAYTNGQWATIYATKRDTDHWTLSGDLDLADPTLAYHRTRKDYVDAQVTSARKNPLVLVTTGGTGASNNGYYYKIASGTITAQYGDIVVTNLVRSTGSGNGSAMGGRVTWRIKQQNAFGGAASVSVSVTELIPGTSGNTMAVSDFACLVTSTAGPTTFDLYIRNPETFSNLQVFEEFQSGTNYTLTYGNAPGVAALPAGTSTTGTAYHTNVLVLATGAAVPGGTPANTVIFRT